MTKKSPYQQAMDCALRRLNSKEHSSTELARFLINKEIDLDIIEKVIHELKQSQLVNDDRYAKLFTRYQVNRGKGPNLIRLKLKQKGIEVTSSQAKQLIEEVSETNELEMAKQIVSRRYPKAKTSKLEANKAFQALVRRGFSFSVAREVIFSDSLGDDF
jgi:regulatory protein